MGTMHLSVVAHISPQPVQAEAQGAEVQNSTVGICTPFAQYNTHVHTLIHISACNHMFLHIQMCTYTLMCVHSNRLAGLELKRYPWGLRPTAMYVCLRGQVLQHEP